MLFNLNSRGTQTEIVEVLENNDSYISEHMEYK